MVGSVLVCVGSKVAILAVCDYLWHGSYSCMHVLKTVADPELEKEGFQRQVRAKRARKF